MWVSKNAEERKQELMDAAVSLFAQKGYDDTSINDIIGKVGVTKGSFYYHFKAKDDILIAVIGELSAGVIDRVSAAAKENGLPATARLLAVIGAVQGFRNDRKSRYDILVPILSREENHILSARFQQAVGESVLPLLAQIIEQGNAEGCFQTADPARSADLVLKLAALYKGSLARQIGKPGLDLDAELAFWQETLERVLGAANGSLPIRPAPTKQSM